MLPTRAIQPAEKQREFPGGPGARRECINAPGGRKIECAGATGAQGRTD